MWRHIEKILPLAAIVVCSVWIVGQCGTVGAESATSSRPEPLKEGDAFYTQLGKAAVERGDNHRAVRLLTSAIAKGGKAEAFKYRSQAYEQLGRRDKASADVDRYIQLKPRDPWGYTKRGTWYNLASQHDKALPQFRKAVELDPSYAASHFGLGVVYTALERHESAVREFRKVLDLEPDNNDAVLNLGVALMLSGRAAEARRELNRALQGLGDPKWKDRIEAWIAALPSRADAEEPPINESIGHGNEPNPPADAGEASGPTRSARVPDVDEHDRDGYGDPKESDTVTPGEPAVLEEEGDTPGADVPDESPDAPTGEDPIVLSGRWNSEYQGVQVGLDINQVGDVISGVLTFDSPLTDSLSFPFDGTFDGKIVRGRSPEGHSFQGTVYGTGKVVGLLKIVNGPTVPVSFMVRPQ
ncbi:MAG: tetratricopeptide repeat protein [Desulfomonilaceae bacterium]|nr:tetratricopeptide repeat protein [Desulfomonilaceae bacterium]